MKGLNIDIWQWLKVGGIDLTKILTTPTFLHFQKATLLQDPLYVSELSPATGSQKPYR